MGRKIPGKKHKGVKDPEKQHAKRLSELQTKINAPPKNIDEQEIPRNLERLIKLTNAVKDNKFEKKKKKIKKDNLIRLSATKIKRPHPKARPEKVVPVLNQYPGESYEAFYDRVNKETAAFIKESQFEAKYNVDVNRNPKTGEIQDVTKRSKEEIDKIKELKNKHKNLGKKKKLTDANGHPKLTKAQKKKQKFLEKKQQQNQEFIDFDQFKDKVEFGDVVHAPPELKPLKNVDKVDKNKKIKSLLLNSIIQENQHLNNNSSKTINRAGKRKDLPLGERRLLEKQQKDVVLAYRQLKTKKMEGLAFTA